MIISLLLACMLQSAAHPFYISMCQIDFRPENQTVELSLKCFADDLEKALQAEFGAPVRLGGPGQSADAASRLHAYVQQHVRLEVNGKLVSLGWVGYELELDAVWMYFEAAGVPAPGTARVFNDVLVREFDTQNNIVQISRSGKTKGLMLGKGKLSGEVVF